MSGISSWLWVAASAASIGSAAPVATAPVGTAPGVASSAAVAQSSYYSWETYKVRLAALARLQGVREATIQTYVPTLDKNERVIDLERTEPQAHSSGGVVGALSPYLRRHVSNSLISRGQANYRDHYTSLRRLEARYGVEPSVLMSIWGMETSYGTVTGSTDLLNALASLGYYGRRRQLFEDEFVSALKLIDLGVSRRQLKGSWAGATGYPQFMPSVALRLRADGDGDGYADIWDNELDGLASIAAYLRDAGWKPNVPWGIPVRTPPQPQSPGDRVANHRAALPAGLSPHSRWLSMREWRALGVAPTGRSLADNEMASLIEPDGPNATAYLLTTNYRSILDYNCSNFYAISVGVLADEIARR